MAKPATSPAGRRMRIGCFADTHTGAYPQYADDRLAEQEAVIRQAIGVFNEEAVDLIVFAGDATHRYKPTPAELLAFTRPLLDAHAPILAINGNTHDGGHIDGPIALELLGLPGQSVLRLSRTPEVIDYFDLHVATLPWAPVNKLVASQNGGDRDHINEQAVAHLLTIARELRRQIPAGCASVLVTHFGITGGTDNLERVAREPILPVEELAGLGFDAVVAGHFHRPEMLTEDDIETGLFDSDPPVFFCGSPYPLDFGEGAYEHGCWLLDVKPGWADARFVPLESRPFVTHDLDLTTDEGIWALGSLPDIPAGAVVRVRYKASRAQAAELDNAAMSRAILDAGAHRVEVIPTILPDQRARVQLDEHATVTDAVTLYLDAQDLDKATRAAMRGQHVRYTEEVGP